MAGNRIVRELNNDYIQNVKTGRKVKINNTGGEYSITVSVPKVDPKPTFAGLVKMWA